MIYVSLPKPSKAQDNSQAPNKSIRSYLRFDGELVVESSGRKYRVETYDTDLNHVYYLFQENDNKYVCQFIIFKKLNKFPSSDSVVGKYPQVCWIYVVSTNTDKDLAFELYKYIISKFGGLWSDVKHTPGAIKLWTKLNSTYRIDYYKFDSSLSKSNEEECFKLYKTLDKEVDLSSSAELYNDKNSCLLAVIE